MCKTTQNEAIGPGILGYKEDLASSGRLLCSLTGTDSLAFDVSLYVQSVSVSLRDRKNSPGFPLKSRSRGGNLSRRLRPRNQQGAKRQIDRPALDLQPKSNASTGPAYVRKPAKQI